MAVTDRPLFRANGGQVGMLAESPFATTLRQSQTTAFPTPGNSNPQYMGQGPQLGQGGPDISNRAIGGTIQQQMQQMYILL